MKLTIMLSMSTQNLCLAVIVMVWGATPSRVRACEDKHPPIATAPVAEFVLHGDCENDVLQLALDPRGVRAVVLENDSTTWIDARDIAGAWHYREWQWWKGHPWGESCRPRYYAQVKFQARRDKQRAVTISYQIDGLDCQQYFRVPDVKSDRAPYWDLVTTIRNASGRDLEEYGQFFACYTQPNHDRSFWYWDESGELIRFADRAVRHLDGYVANPSAYFVNEGAIPHCPRGGGKIVGRWRKPVMVSQSSPAGWRSIILLEEASTAALTQGLEGRAMDYILFPSPIERTLANGAEFSVHIRHVMLRSPKAPTTQQLEELWTDFERSHAATKEIASQ